MGNWQYVVIGVLVLALGVQSKRVEWCHEGRAKDKVVAQAERIRLEGAISAQNEAIAQLAKDSQERKARALNGLKAAQEGTRAARTEVVRLRGLASTSPEASNCAAADAVGEIRKGLAR